jgi:leader peptidase (prepilin peptidase)/N-methyltransferase
VGGARMSVSRSSTDVAVAPPHVRVADDLAAAPHSAASARTAGGEQPRLAIAALPVIAALVVLSFATFSLDRALIAAVFSAVLVVLSAIDIERGIIPNRIVLPATGVILIAQLALFPGHAAEWVLAPLAVAGVLIIPALLGRAWMGMGDIKLALLLGAGLGWEVLGAMVVASLCVFPAAVIVLVRGGLAARKSTIPFGPFLALGGLIVLFASHLGG